MLILTLLWAALSEARLNSDVHMVPGNGCGITTPIVRPKSLRPDTDFKCTLSTSGAERELFRKKCVDAWFDQCRDAMGVTKLADKSGWTASSNEVFGAYDFFEAKWAIDGIVTYSGSGFFLKQKGLIDGWLQVTLNKAFYVTGILKELRRDCCQIQNTFLEIRVGNVDTRSLAKAPLQVNEVCAMGDETFLVTMTHNCTKPLLGHHITLQKMGLSEAPDNWAFSVNEIEVYVATFF